MIPRFLTAAALGALTLSAAGTTASAQTGRPLSPFAIGGQIGTPGVGVQVEYWLTRGLTLRGSFDALKWDVDDTYDGIDYDAEVDFSSPGAFIDWHPMGNALLISAGAWFGDRNVSLDATPTGPTSIGSQTFTPAQIGNLTGQIALENTAPFIGIGYDNTFTKGGRLGFRVLAGAAFGDEPKVELNANGGTLSDQPAFQARLAEEEAQIQAEADDYKVLPVVQLGVTYRF